MKCGRKRKVLLILYFTLKNLSYFMNMYTSLTHAECINGVFYKGQSKYIPYKNLYTFMVK